MEFAISATRLHRPIVRTSSGFSLFKLVVAVKCFSSRLNTYNYRLMPERSADKKSNSGRPSSLTQPRMNPPCKKVRVSVSQPFFQSHLQYVHGIYSFR